MPRRIKKPRRRTTEEVIASIRKPTAPPSRSHGDGRKAADKKACRRKVRHDDD